MKKFVSGVIAAVLLTAGFVAFSGQGAQAAPSRGCTQYTVNCASTKVAAKGNTVKKGVRPTVTVKVRAAGNVKVRGTVSVRYHNKVLRTATYKGKALKLKVRTMKVGKHVVRVVFTPAKSASLKRSVGKATVKVRR